MDYLNKAVDALIPVLYGPAQLDPIQIQEVAKIFKAGVFWVLHGIGSEIGPKTDSDALFQSIAVEVEEFVEEMTQLGFELRKPQSIPIINNNERKRSGASRYTEGCDSSSSRSSLEGSNIDQ